MRKTFANLIKIYQNFFSFDRGLGFFLPFGSGRTNSGSVCRFYPTCSEYTKQSVGKYGIIVGSVKGLLRILRCNPLFIGGFDPVK
ncbi:MAG: hypothetical protein UT38_C0003G0012 [Microgenomates group bacterium GW2011_GWA2_39_19]|nr:MAG: hypothetical protein UT38_C0003G0012 [Microgenomates group bacterium GW2011_GWA2_39_19]HBL52181.1 membrane protein insertion efficiency factor YidD [Candidatus Blackburnbacteria bacterium]